MRLSLSTVDRSYLTPGQARRRRRNLALAQAHAAGASLAVLTELTGLSRSRLKAILAGLREEHAAKVASPHNRYPIRG